MGLIKNLLQLPEMRHAKDLDDPSTSELHRNIILRKPFLKRIYLDFYKDIAHRAGFGKPGKFVEIGSGGGFLKQIYPQVTTSDILKMSSIDMHFSGQNIPLSDESIDAFVMLNVFHHIQDSRKFLKEMQRCLKKDGKIVMIEPANTPWSRLIYQNLHHEPFDPSGSWQLASGGPLSMANGALPWIVFHRDRSRFHEEFPQLRIVDISLHTPLRYLVSGGLSVRALVPNFMYMIIHHIETLCCSWRKDFAMFMTIEISKSS